VEQKATFGAGCFWGVEAAFRQVEGVTRTRVGYSDGTEVVEVTYDPDRVSYDELLGVFWHKHDPTRRNLRRFAFGDKYRSVVLFHDDGQRQAALASKEREQASRDAPIATLIEPAESFEEADARDQQYLEKRGRATCTPTLARVR
jgi:peptide-methionine (S)-S-oxide reductase